MIGRLNGRLGYRAADHALIDVGGVGYLVHCSDRTLAALPGPGEAVSLYTEMIVREDLMQLMGFPSLLEKEWFRLLVSVQGIGAKAAMAILSALGAEGVGRAVALGDWGSVAKAKGVGPKTAQRVTNELKDKAPAVMALGGAAPPEAPEAQVIEAVAPLVPAAPSDAGAQSAALSALQNLGYAPADAASAVAAAAEEGTDEATLIRAALKRLAPKG
ncbi:MAG: Holliday junction branch migration protein RuvA [Shimia sp.]